MSYATTADVQDRMAKTMSAAELSLCGKLLEDAAVFIDACNEKADPEAKRLVSCKMVIRAIGDTENIAGIPIGASQGSVSALGYSQSWTLGNGSAGELYISKAERKLLGVGNKIGSYSPVQELAAEVEP